MQVTNIKLKDDLELTKNILKASEDIYSNLDLEALDNFIAANEDSVNINKYQNDLYACRANIRKLETYVKLNNIDQKVILPDLAKTIHEITHEDIDSILVDISVGEEGIFSAIGKGIAFVFKTIMKIIGGIISFIFNIIKAIINFILGLFGGGSSSGGSGGGGYSTSATTKKTIKNAKKTVKEIKDKVINEIKTEFKKDNNITYKTIYDVITTILKSYAQDFIIKVIKLNTIFATVLPSDNDKNIYYTEATQTLNVNTIEAIFKGLQVDVDKLLDVTIGDFFSQSKKELILEYLTNVTNSLNSIINNDFKNNDILLNSFLNYGSPNLENLNNYFHNLNNILNALIINLRTNNLNLDFYNNLEKVMEDLKEKISEERNKFLGIDFYTEGETEFTTLVTEDLEDLKTVFIEREENNVDGKKLVSLIESTTSKIENKDDIKFGILPKTIITGSGLNIEEIISELNTKSFKNDFCSYVEELSKSYTDKGEVLVKFKEEMDSYKFNSLIVILTVVYLYKLAIVGKAGKSTLTSLLKELNAKINPKIVSTTIRPPELKVRKVNFHFLNNKKEREYIDGFYIAGVSPLTHLDKEKLNTFTKTLDKANGKVKHMDSNVDGVIKRINETKNDNITIFINYIVEFIDNTNFNNLGEVREKINDLFKTFDVKDIISNSEFMLEYSKAALYKEHSMLVKKFILTDLSLVAILTKEFVSLNNVVTGLDLIGDSVFYRLYLDYYGFSADETKHKDKIISDLDQAVAEAEKICNDINKAVDKIIK